MRKLAVLAVFVVALGVAYAHEPPPESKTSCPQQCQRTLFDSFFQVDSLFQAPRGQEQLVAPTSDPLAVEPSNAPCGATAGGVCGKLISAAAQAGSECKCDACAATAKAGACASCKAGECA